ncbi:hypothetical protein CTA1_11532, partial [Colletotrichum tanaceti]
MGPNSATMRPAMIAALLASSALALPTSSRSQESIEQELDQLNSSEPWEKREVPNTEIYGGQPVSNEDPNISKRQSVGIYGGKVVSSTEEADIAKRQSPGIYGGQPVSNGETNINKRQSVGIYGGKVVSSTEEADIAKRQSVGIYGGKVVSSTDEADIAKRQS